MLVGGNRYNWCYRVNFTRHQRCGELALPQSAQCFDVKRSGKGDAGLVAPAELLRPGDETRKHVASWRRRRVWTAAASPREAGLRKRSGNAERIAASRVAAHQDSLSLKWEVANTDRIPKGAPPTRLLRAPSSSNPSSCPSACRWLYTRSVRLN